MTPEMTKRLRGASLEALDVNHRKQKQRLDLHVLWSLLKKLGYADLAKNDLITVLQDLKDRGYVEFDQKRNEWTGEIRVSQIEIEPKGRDLLERTTNDPAVQLD